MLRLVRLNPHQKSIFNGPTKRTLFGDRPFPPPQPTRPIDHLEENTKDDVLSPTFDAVTEDPTLKKNNDPFAFRQSHHFDTYQVLTQLEAQGFTRKQAEVIMKGIKFRLREW